MLQIKNISKKYITGELEQVALNDVSLNLRDNEFVAILGPSGSGKTTLLNIIGGLDRYDSGDLIINGVTTKSYKDRDWDSYRNHTVGFVFQSYNLIPHQNILTNVELALTISGISKKERRHKAEEALIKVGLGDQLHKRPNQLSGGQMQRVAIARSLVNDPDILLADEPTGALDTETSVQVMELLKEVAADRLVVMVTHNPELAERYANRIVTLRDGVITGDSNPLILDDQEEPEHRNLGKASMSFLTSLMLSANNLRTKKARTLLVAFASSIGIIGIALILSLSNGVNRYIETIEEDTLSEYPLQIQKNSFDLSAFMELPEENGENGTISNGKNDATQNGENDTTQNEENGTTSNEENDTTQNEENNGENGTVRERQIVSNMFSRMESNDLGSLKAYLDSGSSIIMNYAKAVEYGYNITPLLFREDGNSYRQVNPDPTFTEYGYSSDTYSMLGFGSDIFYSLPQDENLYIKQYDVKAGRWPENYRECVLILSGTGRISDLLLYSLGLKDADELDKMMKQFAGGENVEVKEAEDQVYSFKDFLGIEFKLVDAAKLYSYDSTYKLWTDKTDDEAFMKKLIRDGESLTIVGVVQPREDTAANMLTTGVGYHYSLYQRVIDGAASSAIVKDQLSNKKRDVFTGKDFDDAAESGGLDMESLFSIDEEAMANAFSFDETKLSLDVSNLSLPQSLNSLGVEDLFNINDLANSIPEVDADTLGSILSDLDIKVNTEEIEGVLRDMAEDYTKYATSDPATDFTKLQDAIQEYLESEETQDKINAMLNQAVSDRSDQVMNMEAMENLLAALATGYQSYAEGKEFENPEDVINDFSDYLSGDGASALINQALEGMREDMARVEMDREQVTELARGITDGYKDYAEKNNKPDPEKISASFGEYFNEEATRKKLEEGVGKIVNVDEVTAQISGRIQDMIGDYSEELSSTLSRAISGAMEKAMSTYSSAIESTISQAMQQMMAGLDEAFSFNQDALTDAFQMNMTEQELQELMASLMSTGAATYENNLRKLGYADISEPFYITIYPKDFVSKAGIVNILDNYNKDMEKAGDEEKVIRYTDIVGTLMSSVTDIVNAISYVLIAFVAISLVVSSLMIGVITYISVLERTKEIGILRAIGASKRNISQVFNAETIIIGLMAGLMGIGLSLFLLIPGNALIHSVTEADVTAHLPVGAAVILILLSVLLTWVGGLIPAKAASRKDPVTALRTE